MCILNKKGLSNMVYFNSSAGTDKSLLDRQSVAAALAIVSVQGQMKRYYRFISESALYGTRAVYANLSARVLTTLNYVFINTKFDANFSLFSEYKIM